MWSENSEAIDIAETLPLINTDSGWRLLPTIWKRSLPRRMHVQKTDFKHLIYYYTTHFLSVLHLCHFEPEEAQRVKCVCFTINFTEVKGLITQDSYYYGTPQKSASSY